MREIKFRGKNIKTNEWVYGCLVNNMWTHSEFSEFEKGSKVCEIITGIYESDNWQEAIEEDSNVVKVYSDSVGQYSGLKDLDGTDIYEGDVYTVSKNNDNGRYGIFFTNGSFCAGISETSCVPLNWTAEDDEYGELTGDIEPENFTARIQIIGNTIDNPELLK